MFPFITNLNSGTASKTSTTSRALVKRKINLRRHQKAPRFLEGACLSFYRIPALHSVCALGRAGSSAPGGSGAGRERGHSARPGGSSQGGALGLHPGRGARTAEPSWGRPAFPGAESPERPSEGVPPALSAGPAAGQGPAGGVGRAREASPRPPARAPRPAARPRARREALPRPPPFKVQFAGRTWKIKPNINRQETPCV